MLRNVQCSESLFAPQRFKIERLIPRKETHASVSASLGVQQNFPDVLRSK